MKCWHHPIPAILLQYRLFYCISQFTSWRLYRSYHLNCHSRFVASYYWAVNLTSLSFDYFAIVTCWLNRWNEHLNSSYSTCSPRWSQLSSRRPLSRSHYTHVKLNHCSASLRLRKHLNSFWCSFHRYFFASYHCCRPNCCFSLPASSEIGLNSHHQKKSAKVNSLA